MAAGQQLGVALIAARGTMSSGIKAMKLWRPAAVAALATVAVACTGGGTTPTTTTTASTTTTSSTTTTTINPNCGLYTPSGVALSAATAAAGDTLTVTGNGVDGTTVVLLLRKVSDFSVEDPGVTAAVGPGGAWSTSLTLPNTLALGEWDVVATAQGCGGEATARFEVV